METTLKQRILGIIVLIALLGLCLAVLLRGNKNTQPHIAQINTHPPITQTTTAVSEDNSSSETSVTTVPQSKPVSVTSPPPLSQPMVSTAQSAALVTTSPTVAPVTPTEPTSIVSEPKPEEVVHHKKTITHTSFHSQSKKVITNEEKNLVVQVGTFTLPANAETLVDKLHEKGFVATMQKMNTVKGQMTRVIVGKKGLNRVQAQALRQKLQKSLQIQGIIVSHESAVTTTSTVKKVSQKTEKTSHQTPATIEDRGN